MIKNGKILGVSQLRRISAILHDLFAALLAWALAFYLRFNFQIPNEYYEPIVTHGLWVVPLEVSIFFYVGLYRGIWRFASLPDLARIIKAATLSALIFAAVMAIIAGYIGYIPRSVYLLNPILLIVIMGGSRFLYRAWKDHRLYSETASIGKPVLIVGAGEITVNLLNDIARSHEWQVKGILDNDTHMFGREIRGVRVLGGIDRLWSLADETGTKHVILALPNSKQALKRQLINEFSGHLNVLVAPSLGDLIAGRSTISMVRKVEVDDLLGRDAVNLDIQGLQHLINNQAILVTGAGGSIGSELCRQILHFNPKILVCVDSSEFSLYALEQELGSNNLVYLTGDAKCESRMRQLVELYRPVAVFHAAAYKHVPLMEHGNVSEALNNNVLGTYNMARICSEIGVKKFVLISTDKAVNPTNVMGASKRLAEMVCQGLQEKNGTSFVIVRFGNVLGSSGSVIPKFREQIAKGGPVTVTHPEITRFFMSIPEAAQLVMQAGLMGNGGEIFVLDMGESMKIAELARNMIRLSGLSEDDIEIRFTGLRPGEKLYEELLADDESTLKTPHEKLRIAKARSVDVKWVEALIKWIQQDLPIDESLIKEELKTWVTEYVGDVNANLQVDKNALMPENYTSGSPSIH